MNKFFLRLFLSFQAVQGCNLREKEENLQKREATLNEKEQQILLREQALQAKELEINKKLQMADSVAISDSVLRFSQKLIGNWLVQMTCSETTCAGSAVGDTKTETWEMLNEGQKMVAKAKVNNELVRIYSGTVTPENVVELEGVQLPDAPPTKILVRLQLANDKRLEGNRAIERTNENCKIVYTMQMDKQ